MSKLYHLFYVSDYKGGELHSYVNLTLKKVAETIIDDSCIWEDIKEYVADQECTKHLSDKEFETISELELLKIIPDDILKDMANDVLYPGNMYAFDSHSDYCCYCSTNLDEKLRIINPINEEGFLKFLREELTDYYTPYE